MVIFTKKFGTLDPHLPIVWDKVPKKRFFLTPSLMIFDVQVVALLLGVAMMVLITQFE